MQGDRVCRFALHGAGHLLVRQVGLGGVDGQRPDPKIRLIVDGILGSGGGGGHFFLLLTFLLLFLFLGFILVEFLNVSWVLGPTLVL